MALNRRQRQVRHERSIDAMIRIVAKRTKLI
jgi:hypothetical protein